VRVYHTRGHRATIYSEGLCPPQTTSMLQWTLSSSTLAKLIQCSLHQACPCAPAPKARQTFARFCPSLAAAEDRQQDEQGHICLGREQGGTGDRRLLDGTGTPRATSPGHVSLPVSRPCCLFIRQSPSSSWYGPVVPHILPLKCCARGTLPSSGAAFPPSLASPSQVLLPSSSGDSSPPLSNSSSPADAFCPSKEPSPVPVGFAGLASVAAASQPGWQFPASSCPSSAAASVEKDRDDHAPGEREPPPHTQKHAENLLAEMGTKRAAMRNESCREPPAAGLPSPPQHSLTPHSSQL